LDDPWTIWWFHVRGTDLNELLAHAGVGTRRPVVTVANPQRLTSLIDEVAYRLERDDSESALIAAAGAAWHALALIAVDQTTAPTRPDPAAQAIEYLQARIGAKVTVKEVSDAVGLSPSRFTAVFRRATGYAMVEYHTRLRLARGAHLLAVTDLPISVIAHRVGYPDAFYFSRRFHAIYGQAPSEYRQAVR
jgi:AraC-like DNA-binding protein